MNASCHILCHGPLSFVRLTQFVSVCPSFLSLSIPCPLCFSLYFSHPLSFLILSTILLSIFLISVSSYQSSFYLSFFHLSFFRPYFCWSIFFRMRHRIFMRGHVCRSVLSSGPYFHQNEIAMKYFGLGLGEAAAATPLLTPLSLKKIMIVLYLFGNYFCTEMFDLCSRFLLYVMT